MTTLNWQEGVPSNASAVGYEPQHLHSVWSSVALGMAVEHYWAGSGGASDASSGDLRPGGSRTFVANQSNVSYAGAEFLARLFYAANTFRLIALDSAGTYMVGSVSGEESLTDGGSGYWAIQTGSYSDNAQSGTTTRTFPQPFLSAPTLISQTIQSGATAIWHTATTRSAATFASTWSALGANNNSQFTVYWEATGLLSSQSY